MLFLNAKNYPVLQKLVLLLLLKPLLLLTLLSLKPLTRLRALLIALVSRLKSSFGISKLAIPSIAF